MQPPHGPHLYPDYSEADLGVFRAFPARTGHGTAGFIGDFLGNRTRTAFAAPFRRFDGRVFGHPVPGDFFAEAIEWLGLLKAVLDAEPRGRLRVLELRAGWAPWLAAGAAAARARGIADVRLCGVEADPGKAPFMALHLADNGIAPEAHALLNAVVGAETGGEARWPVVADPAVHYGLRPLEPDAEGDYLGEPRPEWVAVPVVGLGDLLHREEDWDLVHMDVQGVEAGLCAAAAGELDRRVRRVVVCTHSRKLDGDVADLFFRLGWELEHEKPTRFRFRAGAATLEATTEADGAQVWRNPRFPRGV